MMINDSMKAQTINVVCGIMQQCNIDNRIYTVINNSINTTTSALHNNLFSMLGATMQDFANRRMDFTSQALGDMCLHWLKTVGIPGATQFLQQQQQNNNVLNFSGGGNNSMSAFNLTGNTSAGYNLPSTSLPPATTSVSNTVPNQVQAPQQKVVTEDYTHVNFAYDPVSHEAIQTQGAVSLMRYGHVNMGDNKTTVSSSIIRRSFHNPMDVLKYFRASSASEMWRGPFVHFTMFPELNTLKISTAEYLECVDLILSAFKSGQGLMAVEKAQSAMEQMTPRKSKLFNDLLVSRINSIFRRMLYTPENDAVICIETLDDLEDLFGDDFTLPVANVAGFDTCVYNIIGAAFNSLGQRVLEDFGNVTDPNKSLKAILVPDDNARMGDLLRAPNITYFNPAAPFETEADLIWADAEIAKQFIEDTLSEHTIIRNCHTMLITNIPSIVDYMDEFPRNPNIKVPVHNSVNKYLSKVLETVPATYKDLYPVLKSAMLVSRVDGKRSDGFDLILPLMTRCGMNPKDHPKYMQFTRGKY